MPLKSYSMQMGAQHPLSLIRTGEGLRFFITVDNAPLDVTDDVVEQIEINAKRDQAGKSAG